jgi:hypothetical protein
MSIVLYIFQNAIILGLLFLLGGVIYAKKGRGGNTSLVGGLSMIIGAWLLIKWIIQLVVV